MNLNQYLNMKLNYFILVLVTFLSSFSYAQKCSCGATGTNLCSPQYYTTKSAAETDASTGIPAATIDLSALGLRTDEGQTHQLCYEYTTKASETKIGFRFYVGTPQNCSETRVISISPTCGGASLTPTTTTSAGFNEYIVTPSTKYNICVTLTFDPNDANCDEVDPTKPAEIQYVELYVYNAVSTSSCKASVGTINVTGATSKGNNEYDLNSGSTISIASTGSVMPTTTHVMSYAFFGCDPGTLTSAQLLNLRDHPCYIGSDNKTSTSDLNNNGESKSIAGEKTLWVVPYTRFPDNTGGTKAIVDDGSGCYAIGSTVKINYLPPSTNTCNSCATPSCPVISYTDKVYKAALDTVTDRVGNQVLYNQFLLRGQSTTICVPVTVPTGATMLGFKQIFKSNKTINNTSCASSTDEKVTFKLTSTSCGSAINPTRPNANNVGSGFNPEWDNIAPGNYVLCYTMTVSPTAACDTIRPTAIGYYIVSPNACTASVGTIDVSGATSKGNNEYDLNSGSTISIVSTNAAMPTTTHLMSYAFFGCDPGTLTTAQLLNLRDHPCYIGSDNATTTSDLNNSGESKSITGEDTLWVVPYTRFPDNTGGNKAIVDDGTGCYAIGNTIKINYLPPVIPTCGTCQSATCKVVVSNGATVAAARSQMTTDITAEADGTTHSLTNTIDLKDNGTPVTVCVPVTVPADATNLGFKHAFYNANSGCSLSDVDISRSYKLYPAGCGTPVNPKTANAQPVASGFNPEWDVVTSGAGAGKILPGNYIFCYTMTISSGSLCTSVPGLILGYYTNGTPAPPYTCQTVDFEVQKSGVKTTDFNFTCSDNKVDLVALDPPSSALPDKWIYPGLILYIKPQTGSTWGNTNTLDLVFNGSTAFTAQVLTDLTSAGLTNTDQYVFPVTFAQPGTFAFKINGVSATSTKKFDYIIFNAADGTVADQGTLNNAKTITLSKSPVGTAHYTGPGVTDDPDNGGKGFFDPKVAGAGTHTITYSWDNGTAGTTNCKGTKSITVTVTGGPTITPTFSDVCSGSTSTNLTYTSTGTPTKYSIDWDAAANTAGLTDVNDVALTASPMTITIPSTLVAGTYTCSFTSKNASGCSSEAKTVTFKVNSGPTITGTTPICEGNSASDWTPKTGVTWSSTDATIATVAAGATLSGLKSGTVTITAKDNTTQCSSTKQVIVNAKPTISGTLEVCEGSQITLTGSVSPATNSPWVSATLSNATISNVGVVSAVVGGNGTSEITYTDINGCVDKKTVTVKPSETATITCGNSTATSVTFNWAAVKDATSYDLVYNIDNTGDKTVTGHTQTSYPVSNVPAGKSVTIIVTPKGTGCYKASELKSCTADNCPTPTITKEPRDTSVCDGTSASFSISAKSTASLSYQWQINNGNSAPTDLTNNGVYTGVTDSILKISDVKGLNGVKFQCLVKETTSGTGCNKTSVAAVLTINPIPSFTPTVGNICEGADPTLTYKDLTGSPDIIVFDPNLPLVSPFNIPLTSSPILITGLPVKLPVNTYNGLKVRLENTKTGCKSSDFIIPGFKVQATQTPSISPKATDVSSVTFQWSDLTGLNTQTGAKEDNYTVEEFICSNCNTPGTYTNATGILSFNSTTNRWEYLKNNLQPGDRVFIKVTPKDNAPLVIPSCFSSSVFDLTAIQCDAPVITKDISDIILCEGTSSSPISTSFELEYNSANTTSPLTWEVLAPGGTWTALNITGVYSVSGSTNVNTKLDISDVKGLDGYKYRANLKTQTVGGACNILSKEVLLTVNPLPTMNPIADKSFCPGILVNDPTKSKDFDFKIIQAGTPTFTWVSDLQTTGVKSEGVNNLDGSKKVNEFESFTTLSPSSDAVSTITVTPALDQCIGNPITFKITVKPTIKPINFSTVEDFNSVKFTWSSSSIIPDYWKIDTAITNINAAQPTLALFKNVINPPVLGSTKEYSIGGINSTKKAYIIVTPKQDPSKTDLFCPVSETYMGITTPCVKPNKPEDPIITPVCEGVGFNVNGVNNDLTANFQWKISTDAGLTWSNVSTNDFGSSGTSNSLSTPSSKSYMNNALIKVVLTDKLTGQCVEESNSANLVVNILPNVKLIQPSKTSLCLDDPDVSATVQPLQGKSPMKINYTLNGVVSIDQDISNLDIKFSSSQEKIHSLTIDKVTDANGCVSSLTGLSSNVTVFKNPTPEFSVSDTIGCIPLTVNFTDNSGALYKDVTWDFGTGINSSKQNVTTTFSYQKEGDYTVSYSVEDENGCKAELVLVDIIHVKSTPIAVISNDRNLINIYENEVRFDSKLSQNATFYKWDFGDNSSIEYEPVVKHKYDPSMPGKFKVILIVSNSATNMACSDTATTWIDFPEEVIYYIPNTFTPNGDEFNNTFQPIFSSGYDPQNYSFIVFDRWGQIVFESKNPNVGWDGTYGDKILGNDTFVWKLGFKEKTSDNEHYTTGHVNLVK